MLFDLALSVFLDLAKPLLSQTIKDRLAPKDSATKAKEAALSLYKCLDSVRKDTKAFLNNLNLLVASTNDPYEMSMENSEEAERFEREYLDPLSDSTEDLASSLTRLAYEVDDIDVPLTIYLPEVVSSLRHFTLKRIIVITDVKEIIRSDAIASREDLVTAEQEATENAQLLDYAISEFQQFLADQYKFEELF